MSKEWIFYSSAFFVMCFFLIGTSGGPVAVPVGEYGIATELLTSMTRDQDISALQGYGGASAYDFNIGLSLSLFFLLVKFVFDFKNLSGERLIKYVKDQYRQGNWW